MSPRAKGVLWTLISGAAFGTYAIWVHLARESKRMDAPSLLAFRFLLAGAILAVIVLLRKKPAQEVGHSKNPLSAWAILGVCYIVQSYAYVRALETVSPSMTALLLYLYPIFVTLVSVAFLRQKINRVQFGALFLAVAGTALTLGYATNIDRTGLFWGILSSVGYSAYILLGSKLLVGSDPLKVSTGVMFVAGIANLALALFGNGLVLPLALTDWVGAVGLAIFGTVIALAAFLMGISLIGPVDASTLSAVEPLITLVLSMAFLGDRPQPLQFVGGALILIGVTILVRAKPRAVD